MKSKASLFLLISFLFSSSLFSQDYSGMWMGTLVVNENVKMQIGFEISDLGDGDYSAKMNVIEQNAYDLPMDVCTIKDRALHMEFNAAGIVYDGTFNLKEGKVDGEFKQSGATFDLDLEKKDGLPEKKKRSQLPKRPFPYVEEEVIFKNPGGDALSGTLTMPRKGEKFPAAVLIHGSGELERDETSMGHFLLLADLLTKNGYAVLRYDKRGVGKSTGDYASATTYDFAKDAKAALDYLKSRSEIDKKSIGLIGHSEGTLVASIIAAEHKKDVDFVILMGGIGVPGKELILKQEEIISRISGAPEETISELIEMKAQLYDATIKGGSNEEITGSVEEIYPDIPEALLSMLTWEWFQAFLALDPQPYLREIKCPVLAITGEKDTQCDPEQNLPAIESALKKGGNKYFTVLTMPGQNHLFQRAESGLPLEYEQLDDIIAPSTQHQIISWLNDLK